MNFKKYISSAAIIFLLLNITSCVKKEKSKFETLRELNDEFLKETTIKHYYIEEVDFQIDVFPKIFPPLDCSRLIAKNVLIIAEGKQDVLDIGAGTGILGLTAAKKGSQNVVLTDINPKAIKNILHNARLLELNNIIDTRLATKETGTGAFDVIKGLEKFDLILFHPPSRKGTPKNIAEMALYDEDFDFIKSFFSKAGKHLKDKGVAILGYNSEHPILEKSALENNLKISLIDELKKEDCKVFSIKKSN